MHAHSKRQPNARGRGRRVHRSISIAAAAAVLFASTSCGAHRELAPGSLIGPQLPTAPDRAIVYLAFSQETSRDIFAANPDGSGVVQLSDFAYAQSSISVTADGGTIAFITPDAGNVAGAVGFVDADAQHPRYLRIPGVMIRGALAISPDGSRLAFDRDSAQGLWQANVDGSGRQLLTSDFQVGAIAYSPDGKTIAFTFSSNSHYGAGIAAWHADGTVTFLAGAGSLPSSLAWTPDGSRVFFTEIDESSPGIWAVTSDGKSLAKIANVPSRQDATVSISPNGAWLLATGAGHLYRMHIDGTNVTDITPELPPAGGAIWRENPAIP